MKYTIFTLFFILKLGALYAQESPNIVFFLADDYTYRDIGVYGAKNVKTPAIDQLAKEGMKFEHCYQATAMCAPTRQNILTGIYPVKSGAYPNHSFVKEGTKSIVHYLKDLGYNVALQGKRHISPLSSYPFEFLGDGKQDVRVDLIEPFVKKNVKEEKPFCLFVMSHQPHGPFTKGDPSRFDPDKLELPPYFVDTPEIREQLTKYYAEIEYLDNEVAQVNKVIEEYGIKENTIFIFASEQGSQFPFAKFTCYNNGLQSGLIVRWPGKIKAGSTTNAMVEYVDIAPTMIDIAGGSIPQAMEGESFVKVMTEGVQEHKEYSYGIQTTRGIQKGSDLYAIRTIQDKKYHYIRNLNHDQLFESLSTQPNSKVYKSWREAAEKDPSLKQLTDKYQKRPFEELYNKENDPYELHNLANDPKCIEIKKKLSKKLDEFMLQQGDKGIETEREAFDHVTEHMRKKIMKSQ